jgi:hypothetical protein
MMRSGFAASEFFTFLQRIPADNELSTTMPLPCLAFQSICSVTPERFELARRHGVLGVGLCTFAIR